MEDVKMNYVRLKISILCLVGICLPLQTFCNADPAGTAFTYQGHLTDNSIAVNALYNFKFQLYDDPNHSLNQIGSEVIKNDVTVAEGRFTVKLDFGSDAFNGDKRWLEIAVGDEALTDPNLFETLTPRQELTPTPYALLALKGSYSGSAPVFVNNQTNIIGLNSATDPGDLMTWDGNNWIAKPPAIQHFTINNMQPFLGINYCIALQGLYPSPSAAEPFIAEIMLFAGNFAPPGWAFCDGQLLSVSSNTALFSLVGTIYGGDGETTFGLPELRGRVPLHPGSGPGLTTRQLGQKGGSENVVR